jgi:serine/threonine protein kinase
MMDKGYNVPKLFPMFDTTDFRCHPMEMLDNNLLQEEWDVIQKLDDKSKFQRLNKISRELIHLLIGVHENGNIYGDLSPSNIGLKNKIIYLFDFGEIISLLKPIPLGVASLRYSSRVLHIDHEIRPLATIKDDYEGLGNILLELYYGQNILVDTDHINPTLTPGVLRKSMLETMAEKNNLIKSFIETKKKDPASLFFKKYFTILDNTEISQLDKEYEKFTN